MAIILSVFNFLVEYSLISVKFRWKLQLLKCVTESAFSSSTFLCWVDRPWNTQNYKCCHFSWEKWLSGSKLLSGSNILWSAYSKFLGCGFSMTVESQRFGGQVVDGYFSTCHCWFTGAEVSYEFDLPQVGNVPVQLLILEVFLLFLTHSISKVLIYTDVGAF